MVRQEDDDSSLKAYETSAQTAGRRMVDVGRFGRPTRRLELCRSVP